MSLISADSVGKYYGAHDVFKDVSFRLEHGDRIGLVGLNGEGKTTLLRILAGLEEPNSGTVQRKRGLRIGYLPQDPPALEETTLWEAMLHVFDKLRQMERDLALLAEQMSDPFCPDEILERFSTLQTGFEERGGYTYETRIKTVLAGLGFHPEQYTLPMVHLSGGQRTRALLARLLLEEPDLLLLDEPTNHLDIQAVEWLEGWLQEWKGSLVAVAHDRYFLDKVTNRIWEIAFGSLETYRGNYTAYLHQRQERYQERLNHWDAQQEYIRDTEEFIRRNIAGQRTKEAQGRRTRLERFLETEAIERPREHKQIHLRLPPPPRSGDMVIQTCDLVVGYDAEKPLLRVPNIDVRRGQHTAIVGPNGVGKTTLLRALLGELPPLTGTVRHGVGVSIGYLSQNHSDLDPETTVLDAILSLRPSMVVEDARTLLGSFLFSGDDVFKRIGDVSGGQRSRVAIARLAVQGVNVLLLDEPTNHLDIPSQEVLQDVLQQFSGTLLFVSHDRYLIQALATHIWAIERGTLYPMEGRWEDYLLWHNEDSCNVEKPGSPTRQGWLAQREAQRDARRQQKQMEQLQTRHQEVETTIHQMEEHLHRLGEEIEQAAEARNLDRLHQLGKDYQKVESRLKDLWEEWSQLTEALEK